jgi:hypothetical protein
VRNQPLRVGRDEVVPSEDTSRPLNEPASRPYRLNDCRECGRYKWVYRNVDLYDGKGPGDVCGRCEREKRRPA